MLHYKTSVLLQAVFEVEQLTKTLSFDRDAFLVSGKYAPGGNFDFRFMYAEADELDVSATGNNR